MNNFQKKVRKAFLLIQNPSQTGAMLVSKFGRSMSAFFRDKAFYLQGQMDIHPLSIWHKPEFIKLTNGLFPSKDYTAKRSITDLEPWDTTRRDMLVLLMRMIIVNDITGDFAELGVYQGATARLINRYAPEKKLYLFDTFSGFNKKGAQREKEVTGENISEAQFSDTSIEFVKALIKPNENVSFFAGYFPENLPSNFEQLKFALVHLDADLYDPTLSGLKAFYPLMSKGGVIIIHDYNAWIGARTAVDSFFADKAEKPIPMPDKSGSAIIIKQ